MLYEVLEAIGQTPTEETIAAWVMDIVEDTLNYEIGDEDYEEWARVEKGQPIQIVTNPKYARILFQDFADICLHQYEAVGTAWEDSLEDTQFEGDIATIKYHWLHLDWLKVWECLDKTKISVYKLI